MAPARDWLDVITAVGGILLGFGGLAAFVSSAVVLYRARDERRKASAEAQLTEAETADKYLQVADRAAERALKLDDRVQQLEETVKAQQVVIETLQCENAALRLDHDKLAEEFDKVLAGAHILHAQVIELKGVPKFKPPERRKRSEP